MNRKQFITSMGAVALMGTGAARAQTVTGKPLSIVVPYPPGGSPDITIRALAEKMAEGLQRPVVVDNRPGAGGLIAARYVAQQPPDGSTLFAPTAGNISAPLLQVKPIINPATELVAVARICRLPMVLTISARKWPEVRTFADFLTAARSTPDRMNSGVVAVGTTDHLLTEMLRRHAQIGVENIFYKGAQAAVIDLVAGRLDMQISTYFVFKPHVERGDLRSLVSIDLERNPQAPQLPISAEVGLPNWHLPGWVGLMAHPATPPATVARLSAEVGRVMKLPEVEQRIASVGMVADFGDAQQFAKVVSNAAERLGKAIRDANIRPE